MRPNGRCALNERLLLKILQPILQIDDLTFRPGQSLYCPTNLSVPDLLFEQRQNIFIHPCAPYGQIHVPLVLKIPDPSYLRGQIRVPFGPSGAYSLPLPAIHRTVRGLSEF